MSQCAPTDFSDCSPFAPALEIETRLTSRPRESRSQSQVQQDRADDGNDLEATRSGVRPSREQQREFIGVLLRQDRFTDGRNRSGGADDPTRPDRQSYAASKRAQNIPSPLGPA